MTAKTPPVGHAMVESILVVGQLAVCLVLIVVLFDRAKLNHIALETARLDGDRCAVSTVVCDQSLPFGSYQESIQQIDGRLARLVTGGAIDIDRSGTSSQSDIGWQRSVSEANLALVRNGQSGVSQLFGLPDTSLLRSVSAAARADIGALGSTSTNFRLVTAPDAWYATGSDQEQRIRRGADPLPTLARLLEVTFIPTRDVLMPLADVIGLERQTGSFRDAFHQDGWFNPVEGSLAKKPQGVRQ